MTDEFMTLREAVNCLGGEGARTLNIWALILKPRQENASQHEVFSSLVTVAAEMYLRYMRGAKT